MLFLFFTFSLALDTNASVIVKQTYEYTTDPMSDPHFMDFSPQGELFMVERIDAKVHRWSVTGKYLGAFGKKGQGPGEFMSPQLLYITEKEAWVWDRGTRLYSVFSHEGKFLRNVPAYAGRLRRFALINDNLILVGLQVRDPKNTRMEFHLTDLEGNSVKLLESVKNGMFIDTVEGDNLGHLKAYGPELDIVSNKKGDVWFGFSQTKIVTQLNDKGEVVGKVSLNFPTAPPNDDEIEAFKRMSFNSDSGNSVSMASIPGIKWHYEYDKAFYTHLAVFGDKVAAVLTPISGNDQQKAYNEAFYTILEFKDNGKPLSRGSYRFAEDAQLYYNNGHMVGAFMDEDDEFEIKSFVLKGF